MECLRRKGESGFSSRSTAEEVTDGIDGTALTAIVTGYELETFGGQLASNPRPRSGFETGATSGIGEETARVLALRGVHVVMAVRNTTAGEQVKQKILTGIPAAKVDVMELDLSSMASVRKFASEYKSSNLPLNILINNAGVSGIPFTLSEDGIELQFATNYIDTMKETSNKSNKEGRVINVSSSAYRCTNHPGFRFDRLDVSRCHILAYADSKLANILHANELARRLKDDRVNITANSLHPGAIATNILRQNKFQHCVAFVLGKWFLKSIPQGASTTCYLALHPQVRGVSGEYFSSNNVAKQMRKAKDTELARKLWDSTMDLISAHKHDST